MNKFLKFPCLAFAAFAMAFASCSDDNNGNDEPEIDSTEVAFVKNVFPLGLPESIDGCKLTVNDKGQLAKVTIPDDPDNENGPIDAEIMFEYGDFSRATKFNVHMFIKEDGKVYGDYYIQLNEKGFATYVEENIDGDLCGEYHFSYNNDDQMAYIKIIDVENGSKEVDKEYKLTYTNGDLTKTEAIYEGETYAEIYIYTNSTHKQPVANKGCIMLFAEEDCFDIDLDEFKWAFYAGLLGKATKNLPMGLHDDEDESEEFKWELNSNQLPVKFWSEGDSNVSPDVVIRWK